MENTRKFVAPGRRRGETAEQVLRFVFVLIKLRISDRVPLLSIFGFRFSEKATKVEKKREKFKFINAVSSAQKDEIFIREI